MLVGNVNDEIGLAQLNKEITNIFIFWPQADDLNKIKLLKEYASYIEKKQSFFKERKNDQVFR